MGRLNGGGGGFRPGAGRYDATLWAEPVPEQGKGEDAETYAGRLRDETRRCTRCALAQGRHVTVTGTGPAAARLMVVGERPGAAEDACGQPFSGKAGDLLERMLAAIGESRETAYLTNAVRCRPPDDREPRPEELTECRAWLLAEVRAVRPVAILAAGATPAHVLLNDDSEPIGELRGRVFRTGGAAVVPTWNPAYLLRRPAAKADAWADLKLVRELLRNGRERGDANGR